MMAPHLPAPIPNFCPNFSLLSISVYSFHKYFETGASQNLTNKITDPE